MTSLYSRSLNVVLIGYGFSGKTFHAPLIQSTPGLKLTHVVSSDEAKVKADCLTVQVLDSVETAFLIPEIDLAVIATPNDLHFEQAKKALDCGKHVVIDKPFTTTTKEAEALILLANKKNLLLSIFQNRRWDSDFLTVKKLIEQKKLGEIKQFESHFDRFKPSAKIRWKEQSSRGGGVWNDLGSHLVDQALCLFGMPDSIVSDLEAQRMNSEGIDYFHVLFRYKKLRVILHSTSFAACETPRFVIHGTEGSFVKYGFDPQEDQLKSGLTPDLPGFGHDLRDGFYSVIHDGVERKKIIPTEKGHYRTYYQEIKNSILEGAKNPVSPEGVLQVVKILEQISTPDIHL